jgi:H(+)-translocating pyrophosphatase
MLTDNEVNGIVLFGALVGFVVAAWYNNVVQSFDGHLVVPDQGVNKSDEKSALMGQDVDLNAQQVNVIQNAMMEIKDAIQTGAKAFLYKEYMYMGVFMVLFSAVLMVFLGFTQGWFHATWVTVAFLTGSSTSIIAGWIGMRIAVFANYRTTAMAFNTNSKDYSSCFTMAFKAGAVMGFALVALAMAVMFVLVHAYQAFVFENVYVDEESTRLMYECVAGYGLGGSSIALFGRVGGGIYTKAADVGADTCKITLGFKEDTPRNPAVIADNVGDNVGDIAGMGADLFGSFAESSCAAMIISSQSPLFSNFPAMFFPMTLSAIGIVMCFVCTIFATHLSPVKTQRDVTKVLKYQLWISTLLMTPVTYLLCNATFPATFEVSDVPDVKPIYIFFCVCAGLWSGLLIGLVTECYTSHEFEATREVAEASKTGAATNIIYGIALGYKSVIIPVFCLAITIYVGYGLAGMYGIAVAALGILSTLCVGLTIDAYGPICDNAGGIAEMAYMPEFVREKTDALDAAGNTTAAIGKGFAIGSAALVSLALFGAYVTVVGLKTVDLLHPLAFAGLLVGAMLPYWFSSMTVKSVGKAASDMVAEVTRQNELLNLIDEHGTEKPDYEACIAISTEASLREMIAPGVLVMASPLICGYGFGVECLAGMLCGILVSGVQVAISASNTGGAWDNAKKYVEAGLLGEGYLKGSAAHDAAVVGDTVGDPLKDTSGPSINILIKLTAITSVVFCPSFPSLEDGGYLMQWMHGN